MKKIINLFLALTMSLSLLTGCSNESNKEDNMVSLESVAKLNNTDVDSLNKLYDDNGDLIFLSSDKLADVKITNQDEAYNFLKENLTKLFGLENINFGYLTQYTSPNTGVTYYRFQQYILGNAGDLKDIPLEYLVNTIKLGVNSEGYPIVVSSDLDHSDNLKVDESLIKTVDDAEAIITSMAPGIKIYSDYTGYGWWTDSSTQIFDHILGGQYFSYYVYADNPDYTGDDTNTPYMCYVLYGVTDGSAQLITQLACDELGEYNKTIGNTSIKFFEDKKDVGTYTYTVNFDWMNETDYSYTTAYVGADHRDVTVPVMYCESEGLYYLGNAKHHITTSNYLDFMNSHGSISLLNYYVTDNPSDLSSWHFKNATSADGSITYFDDPNYVISAFAEYYDIVEAFGSKLGMYTSYPDDCYLLCTYHYGTEEYPTKLSDFTLDNAANGGLLYDWIYFTVSPNSACCLDSSVMGHEFTHGINMHFTNIISINETGAFAEGIADMVGYHLAIQIDPSLDTWIFGGNYARKFRSLNDPTSMCNPQYIGGLYYVRPIADILTSDDFLDNGAVHTDCTVLSYLGYYLENGKTENGEENLTSEDGLKLWFETLYLTNFDTDFISEGAYLKYAANALGFSDSKKAMVVDSIKKFGFEDRVVADELLNDCEYQALIVNFNCEDGLNQDKYQFASRLQTPSNAAIIASFTTTSGNEVKVPLNDYANKEYLICYDASNNTYNTKIETDIIFDTPVTFNLKEIVFATETDTYEIPANETIVSMADFANVDPHTITTDYLGKLIVTIPEGASQNTFNVYIITAKQ